MVKALVLALVVSAFAFGSMRATAAPPVDYTITLDQSAPVAEGAAISFSITRDIDTGGPVAWVKVVCDGGVGHETGSGIFIEPAVYWPVLWGQEPSTSGYVANLYAYGTTCTATVFDGNLGPHEASVTFGVQ